MTLDREAVSAIAAEVVRQLHEDILLNSVRAARPLRVEEAMSLTRHKSKAAFYAWCKRNKVRAVRRGYYSQQRLERALLAGR